MSKYRIIGITESIFDKEGKYWRKARIQDTLYPQRQFVVNLNPHAIYIASAVAINDYGKTGDAFVLINDNRKKKLCDWEVGDILEEY